MLKVSLNVFASKEKCRFQYNQHRTKLLFSVVMYAVMLF